MSQDYRISDVSEATPRRWDGPNGTVYYITVHLEGHPKAVSIGKKAPDALKAGDTVFGDIEATTYPEDKFKAGKKVWNENQYRQQAPQQNTIPNISAPPLQDMGNPANVEQNQILDGMRKTYDKLLEIEKKVDKLMYGEPETTAEKVVQDMSQEIDINSIPF
jgi:hypothetical protein